MVMQKLSYLLLCSAAAAAPIFCLGQTAIAPATLPYIAPASGEGELAIKRFQGPPGLRIDLWAAEPLLANPVTFDFDEHGRAYVCETFRLGAGVDDIRGIMSWLDEELASRSVDDREAEMKRHLGERFASYSDKERTNPALGRQVRPRKGRPRHHLCRPVQYAAGRAWGWRPRPTRQCLVRKHSQSVAAS